MGGHVKIQQTCFQIIHMEPSTIFTHYLCTVRKEISQLKSTLLFDFDRPKTNKGGCVGMETELIPFKNSNSCGPFIRLANENPRSLARRLVISPELL